MEKCTQGELNKKDIENIKILSQGQSSDIKEIFRIIRNIELQNATMIAKLDEAIRDNHALKTEVKDHLEQSEKRVVDINKNTMFRTIGCWLFGVIISTALITGIQRMINR